MLPDATPSRKIQERSFSLTDALCSAAPATDARVSRDDLHAAMGLPFMICVPQGDSPSPEDWPLMARDVFLVEAGRLFGLSIRDIHPPEAAIGLDRMAAFRQHFEASYRPLIARALENGQHVLAWQGWPADDRHLWGVIRSVQDDASGLGVCGNTGPGLRDGLSQIASVPLSGPPVQLYVVESTTESSPGAAELWDMVRGHARLALLDECASRFGVSTGLPAIEAWQKQLANLNVESERFASLLEAHRACASEFAAGLFAMVRFTHRAADQVPVTGQATLYTLMAASHKAATALSAMAGTTPASCLQDPTPLHRTMLGQLDGAKSALAEALRTISA